MRRYTPRPRVLRKTNCDAPPRSGPGRNGPAYPSRSAFSFCASGVFIRHPNSGGGPEPPEKTGTLPRHALPRHAGLVVLFRLVLGGSGALLRPQPRLWLTSLGLSVIIGFALLVNTTASGRRRVRLEPWPTFRLFVTPFCISSFAAPVKGKDFYLVFSPDPRRCSPGRRPASPLSSRRGWRSAASSVKKLNHLDRLYRMTLPHPELCHVAQFRTEVGPRSCPGGEFAGACPAR